MRKECPQLDLFVGTQVADHPRLMVASFPMCRMGVARGESSEAGYCKVTTVDRYPKARVETVTIELGLYSKKSN